MLLAPLAILGKLNFPFHFLAVLAGPVVNALTGLAAQFYKIIL